MLPLLLNQSFRNENEAEKVTKDLFNRNNYYLEGN